MFYHSLFIRSCLSTERGSHHPGEHCQPCVGPHTPQPPFPQRGCLYLALPQSVLNLLESAVHPTDRVSATSDARNSVGSSASFFTAGHSHQLTQAICPACGEIPYFPGLRNIAFSVRFSSWLSAGFLVWPPCLPDLESVIPTASTSR